MGDDVGAGLLVDGPVEANYALFEQAGVDVVGVPASSLLGQLGPWVEGEQSERTTVSVTYGVGDHDFGDVGCDCCDGMDKGDIADIDRRPFREIFGIADGLATLLHNVAMVAVGRFGSV